MKPAQCQVKDSVRLWYPVIISVDEDMSHLSFQYGILTARCSTRAPHRTDVTGLERRHGPRIHGKVSHWDEVDAKTEKLRNFSLRNTSSAWRSNVGHFPLVSA